MLKLKGVGPALEIAAEAGNIQMVELLLPKLGWVDNVGRALEMAAAEGNIEIVKLLLPKLGWRDNVGRALEMAAKKGNIEIVKLLLPKLGWRDTVDTALWAATKSGNIEIVTLLFPLLALKIENVDLIVRILDKIKNDYPIKYKEILHDPNFKDAIIYSLFRNRDWVIELLRKGLDNDAAKTQTEQLFIKYLAKNPGAFKKRFFKNEDVVNLIGHYPIISRIVHNVASIEKNDEKNGYVTFVHGRNWEWNYVNDVWNIISAVRDKKDKLPTTITMRQRDIDCDVSKLQRARKNLVTKGVRGEHLVSSTNDPEKDTNEAERSEVTFMNYTGLSHLESEPECSVRYCLENHSATGGASGHAFAQKLIKKYDLTKYQQQFDELYELHQATNEHGELLTISVAKDKVNDIVYPARAGGYKHGDYGLSFIPYKKALQVTQECQAKIADIHDVYLQSSRHEAPIFCAASLNIPGEGEETCKIRSVNLADPEKYKQYQKERQALFEKIQKDMRKK